jgi:membrane protease YdiL (CAAX protease family)
MILLLVMMLVAMLLVSLFANLLGYLLYGGIEFDVELLMSDIRVVKLLQLFQSLFVFVIPSAIAAYLYSTQPFKELYGSSRIRLNILLISAFSIFISQYFIVWTADVNSRLILPDSWVRLSEWIALSEEGAQKLVTMLTESNHGAAFVINIVLLALLPAIGEEWLFRGHLQKYFAGWTKSIHIAIFITSLLFAAMHLQFMSFLPRFFLGIILGYLFYYGGNLWYSIIGHFTNNFLALLFMHTKDAESVVSNQTELQQVINFSLGVALSGLGVIALLYLIRREKNSSPG